MVSFIIVEYNSITELENCVNSIISYPPFGDKIEIVVSSNSCYDRERQMQLLIEYPNLTWVFNESNGGFAYAMNRGLIVARGDFLVIMNPDVRLNTGIDKMSDYMHKHDTIGIIAPKIINVKGEVQDSFRDFITPMNFVERHMKRILGYKQRNELTEFPINVDWVIGAFMMISRKAYETVRGLDEHYFLYCEDMDLYKRMHLKGYDVVYYPMVEIEYEGTRSARRSLKYAGIFLQSLFRYWRKFGIW